MKNISLKIGGMTCSACSSGLEKHLNKQDGVEATVNLVLAQATINYDDKKYKLSDIESFIKEAGFVSLGEYKFDDNKKDNRKQMLFAFLFVLILLMYISMSHMIGLPVIPFLHMVNHPDNYALCLFGLTILFLIYGLDIIVSGFKNLFHKHPNMDTLVTMGVFASFIYSTINTILIINGNSDLVEHLYFESSAMIIYFIKLGRYIDSRSKEKTTEAIKELVTITPEKAYKEYDGKVISLTLDEVKKGDILVCRTGDKIAVDGKITSGTGHFDESFITGESTPVKKGIGDTVVAGSINLDGYVNYSAERIGKDSTVSEIVRLVLDASSTKAPIARIADKISAIFVPGVILIALLTFLISLLFMNFENSFISFVNVLVVACPCALGLATPLAIVVSEGKCARKGIIVKSSEILEIAKDIDTVVFDKTGTLTYGNLNISKIYNYSKIDEEEILKIVKTLEKKSNHPISGAFESIKTDYLVEDFKTLSGIGLSGIVNNKKVYVGNNKLFDKLNIKNKHSKDEDILVNDMNSIVYVIIDNEIVALIGVKDIVRNSVKEVIKRLKNLNKDVIMLSGDNDKVAKSIAESIGIDKVVSNVLPKDKEKYIKEELKDKKVMMVGDGINDAPSLASSLVGVSINSGTDIAMDTADVILMNDNLQNVITLVEISKKTIKIIKENLFWAFFYNIFMIIVATGLLKNFGVSMSPMYGSIFMTISSLTVVFNSLRLRK